MQLRQIFFAAAAMLIGVASCTKNYATQEPTEKVSLTVSINGASTKASAETKDSEANVKTLQVFIFKGDAIDSYGTDKSGSKTINMSATTGERTIYALVNAPDLSTVNSMASLKAEISKLSDNAADAFVMCGNASENLTASSNVNISVSRLAARLRVKKITRKMSAAGLAALAADKFELVRVYCCDVVTDNNYSLSMTEGFTWESSSLAPEAVRGKISTGNSFLYNKPGSAIQLAQDASAEPDMLFYVYPNTTTAENEGALFTRMVIECRIDGLFYTYPIVIAQPVNANKSYELNELVITRLGNPSNGDDVIDPGETERISTSEIPFSITVRDWELVLLGTDGTVTI